MQCNLPTIQNMVIFHNTLLCSTFTHIKSIISNNNPIILIQNCLPRFSKNAYIIHLFPMHTDFWYVTSHTKRVSCEIEHDKSQDWQDKLSKLTTIVAVYNRDYFYSKIYWVHDMMVCCLARAVHLKLCHITTF